MADSATAIVETHLGKLMGDIERTHPMVENGQTISIKSWYAFISLIITKTFSRTLTS